MTTYTAYFRTDAEYATHNFEADTPRQALALARQLYDEDPSGLNFDSYDWTSHVPGRGTALNEIAIYDGGIEVAACLDDDFRMRLAARDLFMALQAIFKWWTERPAFQDGQDDMPAEIFDAMRCAIAKAKGGAV